MSTCTVGAIATYLLIGSAWAQPRTEVDCIGNLEGSRAVGNVRLNLDCARVSSTRRDLRRPTAAFQRAPARFPVLTVVERPRPRVRILTDDYYGDEEVIVRERPVYLRTYSASPDWDDWCPLSWLFGRPW
jgi:hypothetical protein